MVSPATTKRPISVLCLITGLYVGGAEMMLYRLLTRLDRAKFKFVPWGFDLPAVNPKSRPNIDTSGPLFCMIGRNNRDFKTFADAISRTEARGVIITGGRNDIGTVEETGKLHILRDVAMDECIGWMTASTANVILVNDENRGAGHITAVLGMLLEKPHIFSRVSTLSDYLDDGAHGIAVPVGDAGAVAGACHALLKDGALARKMGKAAKTRAETEFSNEAVRGSILNAILAGINRQ